MKRILMMVILFVAMIINAAPYVTNVVVLADDHAFQLGTNFSYHLIHIKLSSFLG